MEVTLALPLWEGVEADAQALVDSWLVKEGDPVQAGQPLVRVVLVKSNLEVESPVAGVVGAILVPAGATFGRGQPLATVTPG
jgi:pyruvate/2-oxoglutarate dehydrogenase complex dihydrolipoamide acyltransferase (E2) component